MQKIWSKLVGGRCRHPHTLAVTSVGIRRIVCETCGHISFEMQGEDERPRDARTGSWWDLGRVVAAVAYVIMGIAWLEHIIFVFPELLLLVIALSLLAGRYTGYRLLELRRFKALLPMRSAP